MENSKEKYLCYVSSVRRYSSRTLDIYSGVLDLYSEFCGGEPSENMTSTMLRSYEVFLLDKKKFDPRTVNLHLSVLSGYCKFLLKEGAIKTNPVKLVSRPKVEKRLPVFYRDESMKAYFDSTASDASLENLSLLVPVSEGVKMDKTTEELYKKRLSRVIISTLASTGMRRSEIIGVQVRNLDFNRKMISVRGKGDKMRDIPLIDELLAEIRAYLRAVEIIWGESPEGDDPLFVTPNRGKLYPVYVDNAIKEALSSVPGITGRKSPHVLRHTLATGLLNNGTDLNSIKELLGHSSLAATQVYTHNSIEKMKSVYAKAHPRAKDNTNTEEK